jgi:hypothetical protein
VKLLARIGGLTGFQARLLFRAFLAIAYYRVALRSRSLESLACADTNPAAAPTAAFTPREVAWAVRAVGNRFPGTRCLACALALRSLLRQEGFHSELRMGVLIEGGMLRAHAWIECAGEALGEDADVASRYTPLQGTLAAGTFG